MRAIVLVGGFGTRLRPLTLTTPKQMLPVLHRPMIERVVEPLVRHGVTEVVLSLGYRPDAFLDRYPDDLCAGAKLFYAVEPEPLDTAGAIRFAATEAGLASTFLVVNGDVLSDLDVSALVDKHHEYGGEATIALTPVDDPSRYGVVPVDDRGRVEAFVEKPPPGEAPTNWINAGTYVCEPAILDRISAAGPMSIEREVFPAMVEEGVLYAMQSPAYWVDAGTPATYLASQLDLIDGRREQVAAQFGQAVDEAASVHPDARVAHSIVGAAASVEAGAEVRDSVVLADARVEAGASVVGSIVGPRAVVGANAQVSELSVLGEEAVVAPGAQLVSARVPESE